MNHVSHIVIAIIHMFTNCIVYILCTVPSSLVNVTIFNVTDGDDIAVFIKWDPPSDPNGVIHYYRIEFEQGLDPLDNDGRAKRNISLNDTVMNVLVNSTSGSSEAPTNVTVSGLG